MYSITLRLAGYRLAIFHTTTQLIVITQLVIHTSSLATQSLSPFHLISEGPQNVKASRYTQSIEFEFMAWFECNFEMGVNQTVVKFIVPWLHRQRVHNGLASRNGATQTAIIFFTIGSSFTQRLNYSINSNVQTRGELGHSKQKFKTWREQESLASFPTRVIWLP